MKPFLGLLLLLCVYGCASRPVTFTYFNLSTNEIYVLNIAGLPPDATPGVLVPVHDENNPLERKACTLFEAVHVRDQLKISWKEGGAVHESLLNRDDLHIPPKLEDSKIRFTYLGKEKWRITLLD